MENRITDCITVIVDQILEEKVVEGRCRRSIGIGMNYSEFVSKRSSLRKPSAIRALQKYINRPGMISFGGGNPNPETFPFESCSIKLKSGRIIEISPDEMQKSLQYSPTLGLVELVEWLKQLQIAMHHRQEHSFDVCIGNGSQDVLTKAFEMLIDPGDTILIEAPAYSGTLSFLRPLECKFAQVDSDENGLDPESLDNILAGYSEESRPRILYTVPVGIHRFLKFKAGIHLVHRQV